MSFHDRAAAALLAQLSLAADGAFLGIGVAYVAYRSIRKLMSTSSALRKIRDAPYVHPSDLRSLISDGDDSNQNSNTEGDNLVVIVRGSVELKSAGVKGNWNGLRGSSGNNALVSQESGDKCVILQRTQICIYSDWRGLFGGNVDLRSILSRSWKEQKSSSTRMVPFVLLEAGKWTDSNYVLVNMEGSRHPLPLTTVYHHLQPINASAYTFLQAFFGLDYPIGLLEEEKILPLGKDISVVGICNLRNGAPEIKSCKDLPYFLFEDDLFQYVSHLFKWRNGLWSELTKDQILADLSFKTKVLMWSGILFGSIAIGILGYSIARNWIRWKERRHQRQAQQQNDSVSDGISAQVAAEEETEDVPDGELCVVCLVRRRRSAFIPCGHLVCCQHCALSVEREVSPKCPVCRQSVRSSVRIYDS